MQDGKIAFVHVAKTAGRSLNDMLRQAYGNEMVCDCGPVDLPAFAKSSNHRLYAGHFSLLEARQAIGPGFFFTFLRDPIERLISHYYHFKNFDDALIESNPQSFWFIPEIKKMPLHKFLVSEFDPIPFHVDNHMTRYFLGFDFFNGMAPVSIRHLSHSRKMAVARHALDALYSLDFVGFTDTMDQSTHTLLGKLGHESVSIATRHINTGSYQKIFDRRALSDDVMMELLRNTEIDRILYENAKELQNRYQAKGVVRHSWLTGRRMPAVIPPDLKQEHPQYPETEPVWANRPKKPLSPLPPPRRESAGECDIVWLASCPRSGNTWLRSMMIALRDGPDIDLHSMQLRAPDLSGPPLSGELRACLAHAADHSPVIVKTHYLFDDAFARLTANGLQPRDQRIVLLVRDPLDMALSQFEFMMLTSMDWVPERETGAWTRLRGKFIREFVETGGRVPYRTSIMVDVQAFLESWHSRIGSQGGLVVRYEDLCADPAGQLGRIAAYAGLPTDPAAIEAAVAACRFEALRALEESSIAEGTDRGSEFFRPWAQAGYAADLRFFNQGRAGRGRELLSMRQVAAMANRFGAVYEPFGYF